MLGGCYVWRGRGNSALFSTPILGPVHLSHVALPEWLNLFNKAVSVRKVIS